MIFQNEDFCLFKDFPFNQLIILKIINFSQLKMLIGFKYTCTLQWILQYHHYYAEYPNIINRQDNNDFNKTKFYSINYIIYPTL